MQRNSLDGFTGTWMSPWTVPAEQPKGSTAGTKLCAAGEGGRKQGRENQLCFILQRKSQRTAPLDLQRREEMDLSSVLMEGGTRTSGVPIQRGLDQMAELMKGDTQYESNERMEGG